MKTRSQHSGRIEAHRPNSKNDTINIMRWRWKRAYEAACKHDGIDPDSKFSVFTSTNPFVQFVDRAYTEYCEAMQQYRAGGYIGLRIEP